MKSSDFRDCPHSFCLPLEDFRMKLWIKDFRIRKLLKRAFFGFTLLGMPFSVYWIVRYLVMNNEHLSYFQIWAMMMVCIAWISYAIVFVSMIMDGEFDSGYR